MGPVRDQAAQRPMEKGSRLWEELSHWVPRGGDGLGRELLAGSSVPRLAPHLLGERRSRLLSLSSKRCFGPTLLKRMFGFASFQSISVSKEKQIEAFAPGQEVSSSPSWARRSQQSVQSDQHIWLHETVKGEHKAVSVLLKALSSC